MKRHLIYVWSVLDPIYMKCTRLQCLEQITGSPNVFRIRLTRYKGREIVLSDGTIIKKNDLLVKIHLHNVRVLRDMEKNKKVLLLYKTVYNSMPALAFHLIHHRQRDQIKGIIGITMIDKGYDRLGFESFSLSSKVYILIKKLSLYPIYFLSKSTSKRNKRSPAPRYLFMSKKCLCSKYTSQKNRMNT